MLPDRFDRRLSYVVLCASLFIVTVLFSVRVQFIPGVYYSLVAVQITVICFAAWKLGAFAVRVEAEQRRRLAVAGGLLIMPWVLFSLLSGFASPAQATAAENRFRYLILLIAAIAIAGGLIVLREALSEAGERFYSTLGFAAIMLATPLYLIWAIILLGTYSSRELVSSAQAPPWITSLADMSDILLFFGCVLTYVATAAFAASLERIHWLGRRATCAFVTASFFAVLCLVMRGLQYPDSTVVFRYWHYIPSFVAGIPAVPWIMPLLFGVVFLRRAGDEPR